MNNNDQLQQAEQLGYNTAKTLIAQGFSRNQVYFGAAAIVAVAQGEPSVNLTGLQITGDDTLIQAWRSRANESHPNTSLRLYAAMAGVSLALKDSPECAI